VSAAFFVFNLILGILLISQFWTLANDVYDPRQARRIFGFIGGGASLGGAMGSGITSWTVAHLGVDNLLLVSAVTIAMSAVIVAGSSAGSRCCTSMARSRTWKRAWAWARRCGC
jgi:ATP/ADP translocase